MLLITFATLFASGYYYATIAKGFFPDEDTGSLLATTEAGQDVSFDAMVAIQQQLAKIVQVRSRGRRGEFDRGCRWPEQFRQFRPHVHRVEAAW